LTTLYLNLIQNKLETARTLISMDLSNLISKLSYVGTLALLGSFLLSGCGEGQLRSDREGEESVMYAVTARIRSLDPGVSGEVSSSMAISKIYEGLLEYDYLKRPYAVKPLLAQEMPTISEDGLVYTFQLREGIFFQDDPCFPDGKGREVTAADFVYSLKRVADVKNASSGFWAVERVLGIQAFREASKGRDETDYSMEVEGLKSLDSRTFQITLTEPYPQFLYVLTMHYCFVVPREAVERYGRAFSNHPVGTGPYRLVSWRRNSRIEFERNPKWAETGRIERYPSEGTEAQAAAGLLKDAGEPIPFIDRIVQYVVDDSTTSWMMFLSGQFSMAGISRDNWEAVVTGDRELNEGLKALGIQLLSSPTLNLFYIGFNWDDPVVGGSRDPEQDLKNRKLRQALSCAFNFDDINRFMNYRLHPANGPVPAELCGSLSEPSPYRYNLEKAKQLLVEAGYPDGIDPQTGRRLELTLELGSADANTRQRIELLADMFSKIGVVLKASYNNWPSFIEKMKRRQAQLFQLGWVADYPDAENFLQLFYSKNESPGPNHANYRNAEFDRLYEQARVMQDSPERTRIYQQMSEIVVEDCPWIFQYQPMSFGLMHQWMENYENHSFPYGMSKYRRINDEVRAAWRRQYGDQEINMAGQE
jgi:oligopeptide transport system substrate-binding protein